MHLIQFKKTPKKKYKHKEIKNFHQSNRPLLNYKKNKIITFLKILNINLIHPMNNKIKKKHFKDKNQSVA